MNRSRREFLKKSVSRGVFSILAINGVFLPGRALGVWQQQNFSAQSFDDTWRLLFAQREVRYDKRLTLEIPRTAENGASVPLTVSCELENIAKIYLLVEKNPFPLSAQFDLYPALDVYIKARVKMAESCDVVVVAETTEKQLLQTRQAVKVSKGGCGG